MTEIRTKDKIFLAFFLPIAIVGAYAWLWRADAAKNIRALERQRSALVTAEDFPYEKRLRENALAAAKTELAAEESAPRPEPKVVAAAEQALAAREREAMRIFRASGLTVVRSEAVDAANGDCIARDALRDAGACDAPALRRYSLDGTYPAVKRALDAFCASRMAVVAERVEMRPAAFARWSIDVWL